MNTLDVSKVIYRNEILKEYPEKFSGTRGKMTDKYHIHLKSNAQPVIPIRVPFSMFNELKETLDNLVIDGIKKPVNKPCEWISSLVICS